MENPVRDAVEIARDATEKISDRFREKHGKTERNEDSSLTGADSDTEPQHLSEQMRQIVQDQKQAHSTYYI